MRLSLASHWTSLPVISRAQKHACVLGVAAIRYSLCRTIAGPRHFDRRAGLKSWHCSSAEKVRHADHGRMYPPNDNRILELLTGITRSKTADRVRYQTEIAGTAPCILDPVGRPAAHWQCVTFQLRSKRRQRVQEPVTSSRGDRDFPARKI